jgi:hypothetical protein
MRFCEGRGANLTVPSDMEVPVFCKLPCETRKLCKLELLLQLYTMRLLGMVSVNLFISNLEASLSLESTSYIFTL